MKVLKKLHTHHYHLTGTHEKWLNENVLFAFLVIFCDEDLCNANKWPYIVLKIEAPVGFTMC
jgi:hypothetical protein